VILSGRIHALLGSLTAPVTCDDDALNDPLSECFSGTRSSDTWRPGVFGMDFTVRLTGEALQPYFGVGYSRLSPRFRVNFTNAVGETDRRRVEVDLNRVAVFAGVSAGVGAAVLAGEGYFTVHDRATVRVLLRLPVGS
jgi:hypothetical protein